MIVKANRRKEKALKERMAGKDVVYSTRIYNRCKQCGRTNGYMRKFSLCRICFREYAREGKIMGVTKSSW